MSDDVRVSLRTFFSPKSGYASTSSASSSCARSLHEGASASVRLVHWTVGAAPSGAGSGFRVCRRTDANATAVGYVGRGTLWYSMVLYGTLWYSRVLQGTPSLPADGCERDGLASRGTWRTPSNLRGRRQRRSMPESPAQRASEQTTKTDEQANEWTSEQPSKQANSK